MTTEQLAWLTLIALSVVVSPWDRKSPGLWDWSILVFLAVAWVITTAS